MKRFYESLLKAEMAVAKFCLLSLSLLVFAAAFARTIRRPINWAIDLATFLFAWCVFIGGDIAMRKDRLFSLSLLTERLGPRARLALKAFNYALILAFCLVMVYFGLKLSLFTRQRTFQGIPGFSYSWVTLSVPVGSALMASTAFLKIRGLLRLRREGGREAGGEGSSEII